MVVHIWIRGLKELNVESHILDGSIGFKFRPVDRVFVVPTFGGLHT